MVHCDIHIINDTTMHEITILHFYFFVFCCRELVLGVNLAKRSWLIVLGQSEQINSRFTSKVTHHFQIVSFFYDSESSFIIMPNNVEKSKVTVPNVNKGTFSLNYSQLYTTKIRWAHLCTKKKPYVRSYTQLEPNKNYLNSHNAFKMHEYISIQKVWKIKLWANQV